MTTVNVFGTPVKGAAEAYNNPNEGGKRDEVVAFVRDEKRKWGTGVSTLCIFYNATGENLTFTNIQHDFYGYLYDSYPVRLQNGQWGGFLHVKTAGVPSGSMAYVVYRCKTPEGDYCHQLLGWDTPWDQISYSTQAYCDIQEDGYNPNPDDVYKGIDGSGRQHTATYKSMFTSATIESDTSPLYEATLTVDATLRKKKNVASKDEATTVA